MAVTFRSKNADTITNWSELTALVKKYPSGPWIFRGQPTSHAPRPKIGRLGAHRNADGKELPPNPDNERRMLDEFKRQAHAMLANRPRQENDLDWLAIAQHHGMPTRLLDWTESVLVAGWFAVEYAGTLEPAPPIIYAVKDLSHVDVHCDPLKISMPQVYRSPFVTPRIPAQRALFTLQPNPETDFIAPTLTTIKFNCSNKQLYEIKEHLDSAGFNRATLFPDLDGLAQHLGWCYKRDNFF